MALIAVTGCSSAASGRHAHDFSVPTGQNVTGFEADRAARVSAGTSEALGTGATSKLAEARGIVGDPTATHAKSVRSKSRTGTEYHVGAGQPYTSIGAVPWYALEGGDTVYIHHRPPERGGPYREKFLVSTRGTAAAWLRVLGVPGPHGELPVISGDGATTSTNMHHRWLAASGRAAIQNLGVVHIAVNSSNALPQYIEIGGLEIADAGAAYSFTGEDGTTAPYAAFSACIYARTAKHVLVHDNVLRNCGLGFYNWIGTGATDTSWDALQVDTVVRGNHFYDNGVVGGYKQHQIYTESDGVVIEGNRFGPMKAGALGSQIKDRSAGTIIRYNWIEQSPAGWDIDLVEPENAWSKDCSTAGNPNGLNCRPYYAHDFVYGNVIVNKCPGRGRCNPNVVHWNEDHQFGDRGRATLAGGKLAFYHNTIAVYADTPGDMYLGFSLFNAHYGGYDCPRGPLPATIDFRNNLVASLARTGTAPRIYLGYCGLENVTLGNSWMTTGWANYSPKAVASSGTVSGAANVEAGRSPGFVDSSTDDVRLSAVSGARSAGGALARDVTSNPLGRDFTPTAQYAWPHTAPPSVRPRASSSAGSALGAFGD
jgi:hypothetical protein